MTLAFEPLPSPDSPLRRIDPRWKLAAVAPALFLIAFLRAPAPCLTALLGAFLLAFLGRLPRRWYLRRLAWLLLLLSPFLLVLPLVMSWRDAGTLAVVVSAKAISLVTLALVLLTSAPFNDSLKAAHSLRIPGLLVQLFALTYRYLFLIAAELGRIRIALRARGYRNRASPRSYRTVAHVMGTMLVRSHERGERVAHAMQCRGFDGRYRSLSDFRTRTLDVGFFLLVLVAASSLLVWDLRERGVL